MRISHRIRTAIALMVISLLSPAAAAQDAPPEVDRIVAKFFAQIEEGNYGEALDGVIATNPHIEAKTPQWANLRAQFAGLEEFLQEYHGHERVATQRVGERFVYVWELGYFEIEPIQFHFTFYRVDGDWRLWTISYDEEVDQTATELARRRLAD